MSISSEIRNETTVAMNLNKHTGVNKKPHRLILKLSLGLFASAFALLGTEVLLAYFSGLDAKYYPARYIRLRERTPSRELLWQASEEFQSNQDGMETTEFRLATDADGFVLPSVACPDPEWGLVFLGGSTTECANIQETNRFPYVVSQQLNSKGCRVLSHNGGAIGNHSMHSINILINKVLPIEPDIVVLMHNINDLTMLLVAGGYHADHASRSLIISEESGFNYHLKGIFKNLLPQAYRLSRLGIGSLKGNNDEFRKFRGKKLKVDEALIAEQFRRSLKAFVAVCEAHDIRPILMTQANRFTETPHPTLMRTWHLDSDYGISYPTFASLYHRFNEIVRMVCRDHNVTLIDLARIIPSDSKHLYDFVHLNDSGARAVALQIVKRLDSLLLPN
jgi:lysophospholipase L1-like esterase